MVNNVKQLHEKSKYSFIFILLLMKVPILQIQLAIFICEVFDNFDITKELLDLIPMTDTITESDLYILFM